MATASIPIHARISGSRFVGIVIAMMLAMMGIDLMFNAGFLARFYAHPGPVLLPARLLFRRIPLGYLSFLISLAFLLWVEWKTGVTSARQGARFGALWGTVTGVAGGLGLFSIVPLGADYLSGVAVMSVVSYSIAGAIGGAGLGGAKIGKLYLAAVVALIFGIATAVALQGIGFAQTEHW